jgi:hypothetical protein
VNVEGKRVNVEGKRGSPVDRKSQTDADSVQHFARRLPPIVRNCFKNGG